MRPLLVAALALTSAAAPALGDGTPPPLAEARALIDRWVSAQNQGDFAAYQALYATAFQGVRRSGQRTVELDRAGWIKDRERMFKKKMVVSAADVEIALAPDGATATLTQTFESGTYRDVGKKRIGLARDGGRLLIAREEMLASAVAAPPASAPAPVKPDDPAILYVRALYPRYDVLTGRIAPGGPIVRQAQLAARKSTAGQAAMLVGLGRGEDELELELAVMGSAGVAPTVLGRRRFTPTAEGPEGGRTWTPSYDLVAESVTLAAAERALAIEVPLTLQENGPSDGSVSRRRLLLFRFDGKRVRPILELQTLDDTSDAECPSATSSSLDSSDRAHGGLFDLTETRSETTSHWNGGNDCHTRTKKTKKVWRWNGSEYE